MDIFVDLARQTIKKFLTENEVLEIKDVVNKLPNIRAGCFVSLHKKDDGQLRSCIGTILPACKNISSEIINNAISVLTDPRFPPVTKDELANLDINVDVLSEPEPINSEKSLDPKKYGVIVKSHDGRTGLLLPDLEGVDDVNYQISIAKDKAGILPNEDIYLYRFTVERHKDS